MKNAFLAVLLVIPIGILAFINLSSSKRKPFKDENQNITKSTTKRVEQKKSIHSNPNVLIDERDGQSYAIAKIGQQTWMMENLNFGSLSKNMEATDNGIFEKSYYQNSDSIGKKYGGLYTWEEAMNYSSSQNLTNGICPQGWHIPSNEEWDILLKYLDKSVNTEQSGWSGNEIASKLTLALKMTDEKGAVYYGNSVSNWYFYLNRISYFWTSTPFSSASAWSRSITSESPQVYRGPGDIKIGMCIRCIKDDL